MSGGGIACATCGVSLGQGVDAKNVIELMPCGCLACNNCLLKAHATRGASFLTCRSCDDNASGGVLVTSHRVYESRSSYSQGVVKEVVQYATSSEVGGRRGGEEGLRLFIDEDHELPDLFSLYEGDLGEKVLSYASSADLCKIDALNKQFRGLMVEAWKERTKERFGMNNGKEGWKLGISFLRKPVFIHINLDQNLRRMHYAGSPKVSTNGSIIAVVSDDGNEGEDYAPTDGINLYNAQSLNHIGKLDGGGGWEVTVCGPIGDETIVTNDLFFTEFRRGDIRRQHRFRNNRNSDGIPSIGCETHFIAVIGNEVKLYKVVSTPELLTLRQSEVLGRACAYEPEHYESKIAWGDDEAHFVIYHSLENFDDEGSGTYEISVWRFDANAGTISLTQTIGAGIELTAVALADDYVVGSSKDKKIHIWNRHTKEKKWGGLCDIEDEDDQLDEVHITYPLSLSCQGHMLITTSHIGCALCVWNMKTGRLEKRYNDADEERVVDMLPDGTDVTRMVYLKHLNGFLCMDGYMNIWTFPTNDNQRDAVLSIRRREEDRRQRKWERNERRRRTEVDRADYGESFGFLG